MDRYKISRPSGSMDGSIYGLQANRVDGWIDLRLGASRTPLGDQGRWMNQLFQDGPKGTPMGDPAKVPAKRMFLQIPCIFTCFFAYVRQGGHREGGLGGIG